MSCDPPAPRCAGANPLAPRLTRWVLNRRNHRKVVLVDGAIAFFGGINFARCYSEDLVGAQAWADLMVRLEGPATREVAALFLGTWARAGGSLEVLPEVVREPRRAGRSQVQVLGRVGLRGSRALRRSFLANLALAEDSVLLAYGYFVPDVSVRRGIARAVRRGAKADLLLPGPTDVRMARWAGQAYYERLLRAGARIREVRHTVLHTKAAVFDDEVAVVGSANLDPRSFHVNVEIVANLFDGAVARLIAAYLRSLWERADEIDLGAWERRSFDRTLGASIAAQVLALESSHDPSRRCRQAVRSPGRLPWDRVAPQGRASAWGPNGAGKTTLRILAGEELPDGRRAPPVIGHLRRRWRRSRGDRPAGGAGGAAEIVDAAVLGR
jgi:cardiolipin synthase